MTAVRLRYWLLPLLCILVVGGALAYRMPYVRHRLNVYLHPELDIKGRGHQPYQAKIAAGSGGLFGKGPGASLQKLTYLPEAQNDYIAAIYAEEFGFLGMLLLILLYYVFCLRWLRNCYPSLFFRRSFFGYSRNGNYWNASFYEFRRCVRIITE